jgi:hypothetical protein
MIGHLDAEVGILSATISIKKLLATKHVKLSVIFS